MTLFRIGIFILGFILSACGSGVPATQMPPAPSATIQPPTDTPIPFTDTPHALTQDLSLFGAIGLNDIQAFALEPVAGEIFTRVMNGFIADAGILEYQILGVTIFPGSSGLLSEITFNVRTADPVWLADGGTPAAGDWINDKCYRFDFVTTETEYQLKNKRLCN